MAEQGRLEAPLAPEIFFQVTPTGIAPGARTRAPEQSPWIVARSRRRYASARSSSRCCLSRFIRLRISSRLSAERWSTKRTPSR